MNPNYNVDPDTGEAIENNSNKIDHACFVWENYVLNSGFKKIFILAHSAGGDCLNAIQDRFKSTFFDQI